MKPIEQNLVAEIESAVESIVSASHRAAVAAIDRAFSRSQQPKRRTLVTSGLERYAPRRSREEIVAVAEQFYRAVDEGPGEAMSVLAEKLGMQARELSKPVEYLKSQGRIKTTGSRQWTRYFPLGNS